MKAKILGAVAALVLAGPAIAADIPVKAPVGKAPFLSNFDVAFGGAIMTDYNFRGVSQSDRHASVNAYVEGRWKTNPSTEYYLGLAGASISWPATTSNLLTDPAAEIDLYGGVRLTAGKWAYDLGWIYYLYPGETSIVTAPFSNSEFYELYAKAAYTVSDALTVGGAIFWSPDYLNYDVDSLYTELNAKYTVKNFYVSGAIAHMHLGGTSWTGVSIPSYNYWNAGFGWTWKQLTLDLRYHDTDMSNAECGRVWNGGGGTTLKTCGSAYIAKLSFDTTVSAHK
jgi:uncharacterized protein (TIGR02001 family)